MDLYLKGGNNINFFWYNLKYSYKFPVAFSIAMKRFWSSAVKNEDNERDINSKINLTFIKITDI